MSCCSPHSITSYILHTHQITPPPLPMDEISVQKDVSPNAIKLFGRQINFPRRDVIYPSGTERIVSQLTCMSSRRVLALSVSIRRANELPKGTSALSISLPQIPKPSLLSPLKRRVLHGGQGQHNHSRCPSPPPLPIKFCSLECLLYHLEVTALPTLSLYRYLPSELNEQQRRVDRLPYTWRIGASFPSVRACNINTPKTPKCLPSAPLLLVSLL